MNVHNKKDGNPHAHIMLTTRHVTPDGFGKKNTDLDSRASLIEWRESWARVNNNKFAEKGLDEHIDHRTLKAQGIDRKPTIHLGHKEAALEHKGIRTERGDYNREVQRRNAERAQKTKQTQETTTQTYDLNTQKNNQGNAERSTLMPAKNSMKELEEHLKAEKAAQITEKLQEQRLAREETENFAKPLKELHEEYITLDKELHAFKEAKDETNYHLPSTTFRAESIDEQTKNIQTLQNRRTTVQTKRKKARLWEKRLKQDLDKEIELIEGELRIAQAHLKVRYNITPEQVPEELKRIEEKIKAFTDKRSQAEQMIPELSKKLETIEKEYHKRKLLTQLRPDREQIEKLLEQWQKPLKSVREQLHYEHINRRLNVIAEENIEDIIKEIERQESKMVRDMLERYREERARIREKELERERIRERSRTITRSR